MGYISRPPISPKYSSTGQLNQKNTNSQKQQETVAAPMVEVTMVDDSVRHPVTARWTRQYQNNQMAKASMDKPSKDSK